MINEKKDACYHKVKSRYSVWPSAYASGALVKCRKKGAKNWGNSRKDEALHTAYFNFAVSLLESMVGPTGKGISQKRIAQATKAAKGGGSKPKKSKKTQITPNVASSIRSRRTALPPARPENTPTSIAAGDQRGGEGPIAVDQRKDPNRPAPGSEEEKRLQRKRSEAKRIEQAKQRFSAGEARAEAAARGSLRRKRKIRKAGIDPKTGEVKLDIGKENIVRALGRAAKEREADDLLNVYQAGKKGRAEGRAKAKAKREKLDFSHTEYQRIGAILAEGKGVMPKKFSVKSGDKSAAGGLTAKGVKRYRAANPGSKLKTAVTTKPSKLKKGSKAANRRKSFCARMGGMKKRLTSSKTANDPNSRINKALRKWNC